MQGAKLLATFAYVLTTFFSSPLQAAESSSEQRPYFYVPEVPADVSGVQFYLLTVGIGNDLPARYGHTGIRIVNPVEKTDVVFNWGKFYFDDPLFALKFYQGDLTYTMGVRSYKRDIEHHRAEQRTMWQEKINLNNKQKRKLYEKIAWNAQPENRDFKYQYWFKNCSTIPRDYLDEVMEGQVRAAYYQADAGKTFRDYVHSNLSLTPGMIPVLDTIMNSRIDRPISKWEEMFLPGKLREHLLALEAVDEHGDPIPGKPLLSETQTLLSYPEVYRDYRVDYWVAGAVLCLVLLIVEYQLKRRAQGFRLLGAALVLFGVTSGFFGTVMLSNWLFSGHEDIWHNVNLLLFSPFDWLYAVIGMRLLKTNAPVKDRIPFVHAGALLSWLHVGAVVVLGVTRMTGWSEQNTTAVLFTFGLPALALMLMVLKYGFATAPIPVNAMPSRSESESPGRPVRAVRTRFSK